MARSEVNYIYDAASSFRAPGLAALTASAVVGVLPLDKLVNVRPSSQRNTLGAQGYTIAIVVEFLDFVAADETYSFSVQTGGATPAVVVATLAVTTVGQYVIKLDSATIEKLDIVHENIELNLVAAGTTPSIRFAAWMI